NMPTPEKVIHIDIPVKLAEVKNVFSIASLSFEGDLPASIFHLGLIKNDSADWKAKTQVVAIFHTNAGHVTLHDQAYNADRKVATGNPYKKLVLDLMKQGVQVKLWEPRRRFITMAMQTYFPASKSTQMLWRERRSWSRRDL